MCHNINDWDYTTNGNVITITDYKGKNPSSLIIPNGADFGFINGQDTSNSYVTVSSSVMRDLAKNATRIGLSKTANNKVVASDTIWQNAFGGVPNKPGTDHNADGGIKYGSPNLTRMDLHNLDTTNITNMSAMFNGGSNLTTIGDVSQWDTNKVTDISQMFMNAKALRHLNISNWNLTKLANKNAMNYMFAKDTYLTVIANDLKLPAWYQNEVNNADYFWNSHMAVITNVPELIKAIGDFNDLKIDNQNASRSIFSYCINKTSCLKLIQLNLIMN